MSAAFLAALLAPVAPITDAMEAVDFGLADELADIREAQGFVAKITRQRDSYPVGSWDHSAEQILLNWWTKELSSLTGGLTDAQ